MLDRGAGRRHVRLIRLHALVAAAVLAAAVVVTVTRSEPAAARPAPPRPAAGVPHTITGPAAPTLTPDAEPRARHPSRQVAEASVATRLSNVWGIDVSWPQCDPGALPDLEAGFVIVGVTGGRPFTTNPCLDEQVRYARRHSGYAAYLNIDAPRAGDPAAYGRRVALDGLARAREAGLRPATLWLDVEVQNHWADAATNVAVLNGAIRALRHRHVAPGIYSSVPMWAEITGSGDPGVPVWLATSVTDYRLLQPECRTGLGGRPAVMAQYVATTGTQLIDVDVLCDDALPDVVSMFAVGRS